jgi:hypothetical protein
VIPDELAVGPNNGLIHDILRPELTRPQIAGRFTGGELADDEAI